MNFKAFLGLFLELFSGLFFWNPFSSVLFTMSMHLSDQLVVVVCETVMES